MPETAAAWKIERHDQPAAERHAAAAALVSSPTWRVVRTALIASPEAPALVLGSGQPVSHVDVERAAARGVAVARRRSGGAAVLVGSGQCLWLDLVVPAGDPLWVDDVGRASWWVGELWAGALDAAGARGGEVWRQGLRSTQWSSRVCFGGIGPGEVTIGGRKVVGISQRRTRHGALFQSAGLIRWEPSDLVDLLLLSDADRERARADLEPMAMGVGSPTSERLEAALVAALDSSPALRPANIAPAFVSGQAGAPAMTRAPSDGSIGRSGSPRSL